VPLSNNSAECSKHVLAAERLEDDRPGTLADRLANVGVRTSRDYHDVRSRLHLAKLAKDRDTVKLGHPEVEQNRVVSIGNVRSERLAAVLGLEDLVASAAQDRGAQPPHRRHVVRDQHPHSLAPCASTST
jgi:hypothetical protein